MRSPSHRLRPAAVNVTPSLTPTTPSPPGAANITMAIGAGSFHLDTLDRRDAV